MVVPLLSVMKGGLHLPSTKDALRMGAKILPDSDSAEHRLPESSKFFASSGKVLQKVINLFLVEKYEKFDIDILTIPFSEKENCCTAQNNISYTF